MDYNMVPSSMPLCRLCGILSHPAIDVFDENLRPRASNGSTLRDNIFRCVDVRVERDDETTKVCAHCFSQIHNFVGFRGICAATNIKMQKSQRRRSVSSGNAIGGTYQLHQSSTETMNSSRRVVLQNRYPLCGPSVEFISLIDDETDSETDETHASREITNETPIANVEVTSLNGRTAATIQGAEVNSDGVENDKRVKRGPEGSANTDQQSPAKKSTRSHGGEGTQQSSNNNVSTDNATTAHSAFREPEKDSKTVHQQIVKRSRINCKQGRRLFEHCIPFGGLTVAGGPMDGDEHDGRPQRSGNFTGKAVKNMSKMLVKCRKNGRCKEEYESWDAMMYHVTTYHAKGVKRTFCCHLCKKTFAEKRSVQRHMNSVHNREIRFICPIQRCAQIFTRKCSLKEHTNAVHTKRVAYKCPKCPMKFYWKKLLTRHLANKHGVGMTFSCYLCKKASYGKQALQMHMNSLHTGQVRFTCQFPMCSKSFNQKCSLNKHTNAIHTKKNVFKCTACDKKFYDKSNLNTHIAKKH